MCVILRRGVRGTFRALPHCLLIHSRKRLSGASFCIWKWYILILHNYTYRCFCNIWVLDFILHTEKKKPESHRLGVGENCSLMVKTLRLSDFLFPPWGGGHCPLRSCCAALSRRISSGDRVQLKPGTTVEQSYPCSSVVIGWMLWHLELNTFSFWGHCKQWILLFIRL